jgi:hypothetical protein
MSQVPSAMILQLTQAVPAREILHPPLTLESCVTVAILGVGLTHLGSFPALMPRNHSGKGSKHTGLAAVHSKDSTQPQCAYPKNSCRDFVKNPRPPYAMVGREMIQGSFVQWAVEKGTLQHPAHAQTPLWQQALPPEQPHQYLTDTS